MGAWFQRSVECAGVSANVSADDEDLGFVIDNKGSSCPTKESEEDFVIDNKEDPGGSGQEEQVPTEIPPVKKLKRRNVALYKPTEEEDSE